jgi:hypothetical protein
MGALTNYVTITIQRNSVGITRAGFGTLLILTPNFVGAPARTASYTDLAGVAEDYADDTSMEYRAAEAAFSQDPAPTKVKFGRLANAPTMKYRIDVAAIRDSHDYEIAVAGDGITDETVSITSGGTATNDAICASLVTDLNAVVGKNYTAAVVVGVGDTDYIEVTGTAAGDWFSLSVVSTDDLEIALTHVDPGYTADLNAIKIADPDFYMVWNGFNSNAVGLTIAAWCETNKRTYLLDSNESDIITTASSGATDTCADVKTAGYDNTMVMYHHIPAECAGAAWAGSCLPFDPGSETWADKQLTGVTASPLTQTHRDNLTEKYGNGFEQVLADVAVTFDGRVGSGEFFDTTRFLHWFEDDAARGIFGVKVANAKIPMSNPGIAKIEAELRRSLARGEERTGFLPGWSVTVPDAADISEADRTSRTLNGVQANAQLAGAVHKVNATINVIA